jgi:CHAT domain-containing protein
MSRISKVLVEGKRKLPIMNAAIADINMDALHKTFQLLFERAIPFLRNARHITIVSDGTLSNFPFEMLVTRLDKRTSSSSHCEPRFLIEDFEINYALSAAIALDEKSCLHHASRTILAVGDAIPSTKSDESDGFSNRGETRLPSSNYAHSYPGVRRELAAIKRIFGQRADVLSQWDATPRTFMKEAPEYRILHVAAHVDFDESRPLYSLIVLSPDIATDEKKGIRAIDFLSFELNADLVVLSGCNTGRTSSRAELSGMTSTIMLSGVPSVVASLWNVDDEVTAQMMEAFYAYLNAGRGKGESLRLAKLDMLKSGRSDPFYWGAFVLCGDGGKMSLAMESRSVFGTTSVAQAILGFAIVWSTYRIIIRKRRKIVSHP